MGGAPEFTRLFAEEIIPRLRTQRGFQDEISFVAAQRNAINFRDNQGDADAYNHAVYLDILKVLSKVIESLPLVETSEVVGSTFHGIAASRA